MDGADGGIADSDQDDSDLEATKGGNEYAEELQIDPEDMELLDKYFTPSQNKRKTIADIIEEKLAEAEAAERGAGDNDRMDGGEMKGDGPGEYIVCMMLVYLITISNRLG